VSKIVNGTATAYVQDVAAPLPVMLAETTAGQTSLYVYGNDLETWVDAAGIPTFYHNDGLGSTRNLSNDAGQSAVQYSYDVFGAVRRMTGASANEFTFTGEQASAETALLFLRARYYDVRVGRVGLGGGLSGELGVVKDLPRQGLSFGAKISGAGGTLKGTTSGNLGLGLNTGTVLSASATARYSWVKRSWENWDDLYRQSILYPELGEVLGVLQSLHHESPPDDGGGYVRDVSEHSPGTGDWGGPPSGGK
jgi:hypothetical protein